MFSNGNVIVIQILHNPAAVKRTLRGIKQCHQHNTYTMDLQEERLDSSCWAACLAGRQMSLFLRSLSTLL